MRIFRYVVVLGLVALFVAVFVAPQAAHALSALCSGSSGPTCAPTATPTPAVSVSAHCGASGSSPSCTLTGAAPGDTVIANLPTPATINNPLNWAPLIITTFTGGIHNVYWHVITPQEGTSPTISAFTGGTSSCLAMAAFRGLMPPSPDPIGTNKNIAASTTYTFNAFTTINNDTLAIAMTAFGGGPNSISSEPAGYTAAQETSATAATFGCSIAYKVKATAGAETPGNVTLASSGAGDTFVMGLFLQN